MHIKAAQILPHIYAIFIPRLVVHQVMTGQQLMALPGASLSAYDQYYYHLRQTISELLTSDYHILQHVHFVQKLHIHSFIIFNVHVHSLDYSR